MKVESVKHFKKLVADFRLLTTKIQKDYQIKSKNLKETNQVLEACKKKYRKLYLEHEALRKKFRKNCSNAKSNLKIGQYLIQKNKTKKSI